MNFLSSDLYRRSLGCPGRERLY